ncbi:hypothetical protein [Mycobacterium paraintracellulare]|uniref:hypothetical protein n=1 Tax=Mycobacterium paraintracellulare TaxID=1138383 RepID=UPI0019292E1C|nr:hypothetical protein [Mycobacterium paraintracellulare]BCP05411.1 hypothetical protein MINTM019_28670 [Mycobacterium paraintracellulare]
MNFQAFQLTSEQRLRLLDAQTECTVSWRNAEGWPIAAIQSFVWEDDAFWVTSFRDRPRVTLLTADPRSAVTVSSAGTGLGPDWMVSARALAHVHGDASTAEWFYPAFCRRVTSDERSALAMAGVLAGQPRAIIELRPQAWNSFDGMRMRRQSVR